MTIRATCPRCRTEITADDEDDLVAKVQTHAREYHKLSHTLPRQHILTLLRRQATDQ